VSKFLLLLGPSGVGKSAIIEELSLIDQRFIYVTPYMTRPLREGERNKISIDDAKMNEMAAHGEFLAINELYGIRYATPKLLITRALADNKFPVLDWPISKIGIMTKAFPCRLHIVYVSPPSVEVLQKRLEKDGRDKDGSRLRSACEELEEYWSSQYAGICDFEVVSEENQIKKIANAIYANYVT
jgi:guanylate kinase